MAKDGIKLGWDEGEKVEALDSVVGTIAGRSQKSMRTGMKGK